MTESVRTAFAGVSNVLVTDGSTSLLVDGYFSRLSKSKLSMRRIAPDVSRIDDALKMLEVDRLDAVLVGHSHADHVLDAPVVADRTGAVLAGSRSTRMVQEGYGFADRPFEDLGDGRTLTFGDFTVTAIVGRHSDDDRIPGEITEPVVPPAKLKAFRTGTVYTFHIAHPRGTVLVHGTANFIPGALQNHPADVVYLGIGAIGRKTDEWREEYWDQTVGATGAKVVRPVHWDSFWMPLGKGLAPLSPSVDRLDVTQASFERLAARDEVDFHLPMLWDHEVLARSSRR